MQSKIIAKHAHVTGQDLLLVLMTDQSHKHCLVHQGKAFFALEYDFMSHNDFLQKTWATILAAAKRTSDLNLQATEEYSQLTTQEMCGADPTKDAFDHVFFSKLSLVC